MEIIREGIAVFRKIYMRSEEVIDLAENGEWRDGTAGQGTDPKVRITSIHDLDNQTELHRDLLETHISAINEYVEKYSHCRISRAEHLRVARYGIDGHYALHSDSGGSERTLSAVLYLNGDMKGGELNFPNQNVKILPEEGMLVLFPSNYLFTHASLPVTEGSKYCVISWYK